MATGWRPRPGKHRPVCALGILCTSWRSTSLVRWACVMAPVNESQGPSHHSQEGIGPERWTLRPLDTPTTCAPVQPPLSAGGLSLGWAFVVCGSCCGLPPDAVLATPARPAAPSVLSLHVPVGKVQHSLVCPGPTRHSHSHCPYRRLWARAGTGCQVRGLGHIHSALLSGHLPSLAAVSAGARPCPGSAYGKVVGTELRLQNGQQLVASWD